MRSDYDLMILGGGCAGLSLGMRLAKLADRCPLTLLVERRTEYENDKTWCFWDDGSSSAGHLARHRWGSMRITLASQTATLSCLKAPYTMVEGGAFYSGALREIAKSDRITLAKGLVPLREPFRRGNLWHVETASGCFKARMIVDTRPESTPCQGGAMLWQSFHGQEIECNEPIFDPSTLELMDFSRTSSGRIQFVYVLPMSHRRALVEVTVLSPDPVEHAELSAELAIATARYSQGSLFSVVRSEHGILPMGKTGVKVPKGARPDPTYVRAGLSGGAARPSTGYAFQRIQHWADLCGAKLAEGKLPIAHPADPPLLRALDHLFLSVLRSRPEQAPSLFYSLFDKTSTPRLIRFLSDRATALDYVSVACALPFLLFIQEIPRVVMKQIFQPRESLGI